MFFGFYFFDDNREEMELLKQIIKIFDKNIVILSYITTGNYEIIIEKKISDYENNDYIETENIYKYFPELTNWKDWNIIRHIPDVEMMQIKVELEQNCVNKYNHRLYIYSDFHPIKQKFIFNDQIEKIMELVKMFNYSENISEIKKWNKKFLKYNFFDYSAFITYCLTEYRYE